MQDEDEDEDMMQVLYYFFRDKVFLIKGIMPNSSTFYNKLWTERLFAKGELQKVVDAEMQVHFMKTYLKYKEGKLSHWKSNKNGVIAPILLLDQIPRNIFRGTSKMYETDADALKIVKEIFNTPAELEFNAVERGILCFPFIHSENIEDQLLSIKKTQEIKKLKNGYNNEVIDGFEKISKNHYEPIAAFGRFPERNEVLKRQTTEKEQGYLDAIYN